MKKITEILNESSLSRIYRHINAHENVSISAFRDKLINCSKTIETPIDNKERNKELKAILLSKGYGVTAIDGSFIENFNQSNAVEVKEDSFLVTNLKDNTSFISDLIELGEIYCQDSILVIPKGGKDAYLYGTNYSEFPSYGKSITVGNLIMGKESEFMSKVNNRPYVFETYQDLNKNQRMAVKAISKKYL